MEPLFPIEITLNVKGKEKPAIIFGVVPGSNGKGFRVRFSDGFEDIFYLAGEEDTLGPLGRKEGWQPYGEALHGDLVIVSLLEPGQFFKVFRHGSKDTRINVWVTEEFPGRGRNLFYVFYDQYCRFRFTLDEQRGEAVADNMFSGEVEIDQQIMEKAGQLIAAGLAKA